MYSTQEVQLLKMKNSSKTNSTRYHDNSNDKMIPTVRPQAVKQQENILQHKEKTVEKDTPIKTEDVSKSSNEGTFITKPKDSSIAKSYKKEALVTKPKSFSNLVCS